MNFTLYLLYFDGYAVFFCAKIQSQGDDKMFSDEMLEKLFSDDGMRKIPVGAQATAVSAFERVLEQVEKENPYATISELFYATE